MTDATTILERLRDPLPEGPLGRLAALVVDDALGRTIEEIVDVTTAAAALRDVLRAVTASDAAAARIVELAGAAEKTLAADKEALGALLPEPLKQGARELASLQATPPREIVVKLLDREPLKKLLRAQVVDTLTAFGRRGASTVTDNAIARGLGGLGKLALGGSKIATAVSGEVERQMEKRAADFADTAVAGILDGLADQISDPARAKEQAAMRLAVLDGLLGLTGAEAAQLAKGPVAERVAAVRKALGAWAAEDSFEADVGSVVRTVLAEDWGRTLGEVLEGFGVKDVVKGRAVEMARERMADVVGGERFAEWLAGVVGG